VKCDHRSLDLVYSVSDQIRVLDKKLQFKSSVLINSNISKLIVESVGVDCDYDDRTIFWTDHGSEQINSVRLNDSHSSVVTTKIISAEGIACDWITKKLYWTDSETKRIEVSNYDGSSRAVVVHDNLFLPRAIALVPSEG